MVNSDSVSQVVLNGGKTNSSFTLAAPHKSTGSGSSEEENEGQIRVGREYQAVPPPYIPLGERRGEQEHSAERAMLVWSPCTEEDTKLDNFIHTAKDRYGYNAEQALGMLFWHKHNMDRALEDLGNFTPFPDEWSVVDKVLFEQAFQFHGKYFQRIRQMLPDKSIGALVQHYYRWKKTRTRTSMLDRQAMRLTAVREEGLFGEENYPETGSDSEQERPTTGTRWKDAAKSPGSVRSKSVPPRGMNINKDDLEALGTGKGEKIMEGLDREIASCKRLVQNNKQLLSGLRRKTREVENTMASYRGEQTDVVSARWTEQELLLGVEGVRMCGKNFSAIASILGTKTAEHVQTFFDTYRQKFKLETVYQEWLHIGQNDE